MPHAREHTGFSAAPQHGAATRWIAQRYPDAPQPVIDLSTGINPYAYPTGGIDAALYHRLPDPVELAEAEAACRDYYHAGDAQIVLSPGMQPLLFAIAARAPCHVAILGPTYGEHRRVWESLGHRVTEHATLAELPDADVLVLCNPNNPTGTLHSPETLAAYLSRYPLCIADESFADLAPENSLRAAPNLIILRSIGKFFGLAGLRVSAAICHEPLASRLRAATGPWPIATPACRLLPAMLADRDWQQDTRRILREESIPYRGMLKRYFNLIGHSALFTLVETPHAAAWADQLAAQGIAVRHFDEHPNWLRFGLPSKEQLPRIEAALQHFRP